MLKNKQSAFHAVEKKLDKNKNGVNKERYSELLYTKTYAKQVLGGAWPHTSGSDSASE